MSANAEQVHHEDQRLARLDDRRGAAVAVGEVRRDGQLTAAADLHPGHAAVPARDDPALAERELERGVAVPGGVELLAGRVRDTDVVHGDVVARGRLWAVALPQVLDLQIGGRRALR